MKESKPPIPDRVYRIEIVVSDPDTNGKKLRWLLEEAGEVRDIKMIGFPIPKYSY